MNVLTRIFVRPASIPDREQVDEPQLCPPHDFDAGWASPRNAFNNDETIPALYCRSCGDIRAFRIPSE